jgi:transcriptional regulator with GAF, ATPase, and Fis domain
VSTTQDSATEGSQRVIAELRQERDAAVAQKAALAEVLDVINRSPDPGPVFEAILDKAHRLCGAAVGALMTFDGKNFRAMATQGHPEQYAASVRHSLKPNNYHKALLRGDRLVHIPDVRAEDWGADADIARVFFASTDLRSMLMVPFRKDGALLGFISAFRKEVRPFSDVEVAADHGAARGAGAADRDCRGAAGHQRLP